VRTYEQIRNLQPDDARARSSLIELYFRLGQETQAMLELDNYLAFLINAGRIDDSIRFIENRVKEEPNRPHVRRRLAELYKRTGRTADAIAQLDAAGESLLDAGDKASAAQVIESILAMHPENAEAYQNLLAQIKGG